MSRLLWEALIAKQTTSIADGDKLLVRASSARSAARTCEHTLTAQCAALILRFSRYAFIQYDPRFTLDTAVGRPQRPAAAKPTMAKRKT